MVLIEELDERKEPGNGTRRQRRAAERKEFTQKTKPPLIERIKLREVPVDSPEGARIKAQMGPRAASRGAGAAGTDVTEKDEGDDAYWLVLPMFFVHTILALLVRFQYGQEATLKLAVKDSWVSIPLFAALFTFFHPLRARLWARCLLLCASIAVGAYLVYVANEEGYYATMQRSPALGTLWVWMFVEMPYQLAVVCLAAVGAFTYLMDYHL